MLKQLVNLFCVNQFKLPVVVVVVVFVVVVVVKYSYVIKTSFLVLCRWIVMTLKFH